MAVYDRAIVRLLPAVPKPVVRRIAERYIAGTEPEDAIRVARDLNAQRKMATIDVLAEAITNSDEAQEIVRAYLHVFEAIERPRRLLLATTETRPDGSAFAFSTEFTFAPRDGATLMTMVQWSFPSDELRDEHDRGLPQAFDRLERAL